jgi:hypothetical protein
MPLSIGDQPPADLKGTYLYSFTRVRISHMMIDHFQAIVASDLEYLLDGHG